jgi:acyl-homoserine-lactone acylase
VTLLLSLLACNPDADVGPHDATVRGDSWGVPDVLAEGAGSLDYGLGYAFARDHVCVLADQVLRARSVRALYLGPGDDDVNPDSDFGWLHMGVMAQAVEGLSTLETDLQAALHKYADGYNPDHRRIPHQLRQHLHPDRRS